jgi:hypothetical protein
LGRIGLVILVAVATFGFGAGTASACSCAGLENVWDAVGSSSAAFVGTLVDERGGGIAATNSEAIFVFGVETWVKGDLGRLIEVRGATQDTACGLGSPSDVRRGLLLYEDDDGVVSSSSCDAIDPDVLLSVAESPPPRPELVPRVLVGIPSDNSVIMLSEEGQYVGSLDLSPRAVNRGATLGLSLCPGGALLVQQTRSGAAVWDLNTYRVVSRYRQPSDRVDGILCRAADASSIWDLSGTNQAGQYIYELVPESHALLETPAGSGELGATHVVLGDEEQSEVIRFDYETEEVLTLAAVAPDAASSVSGAANPENGISAVVEVKYSGNGQTSSTLTIVDEFGRVAGDYSIEGEASTPVWLDANRVAVFSYDGEDDSTLHVTDVASDGVSLIDGFTASVVAADGPIVYGASGGTIRRGDLRTGDREDLITLPTQVISDLVVVEGLEPPGAALVGVLGPPSTETTTPPLFRPQASISIVDHSALQSMAKWTWILVVAALAVGIVLLVVRRRSGQGDQAQ